MNINNSADKAAILLLSMGESAASKVVATLDREELVTISHKMAKLKGLTNNQLAKTIESFFEEFQDHSGISSASRDYLQKTLDMAIGPKLTQSMIDSIYGDALKSEFQKLQWVPPETLARFFMNEHPHMQAVLLSFMPPDSASQVLEHLPADTHKDLMYRVANLKEVNEQILTELRETLKRCFDYVSHQNVSRVDGLKQAADILNRFAGDSSGIMEEFRQKDEDLANLVTENMYDFVTLGRQTPDVLQSLVQEINEGTLSMALKGAEEKIYSSIMKALPKRMAENIQDQMKMLGAVPESRVEEARKEVMQTVRELHQDETIDYQIFEEKVVE